MQDYYLLCIKNKLLRMRENRYRTYLVAFIIIFYLLLCILFVASIPLDKNVSTICVITEKTNLLRAALSNDFINSVK